MKGQGFIWIIIVLILAGVGGYFLLTNMSGGTAKDVADVLADTGCDTGPFLYTNAYDAINTGTAVTDNARGLRNKIPIGANTEGTTTYVKEETIELLVGASGYPNVSASFGPVKCGTNTVPIALSKLDGVGEIKIYNTAGNILGDGYEGIDTYENQSTSSTPMNLKMTYTVPADEAVEMMVLVIECSNGTEIDDIELSSSSGAKVSKGTLPEFHSTESSDNIEVTRTFEITDIDDDGQQEVFNINIQPESGKTMGTGDNACYVTPYVGQAFIDTDGSIKVGIEDSEGGSEYVVSSSGSSGDYDFSIGNGV